MKLCEHGRLGGICLDCGATKPRMWPYDLVIILGAGYEMPEGGLTPKSRAETLLNYESRLRLDAGGLLFNHGAIETIMTTGGPALSEKWQGFPPLGELGDEYLEQEYGLPLERTLIEHCSDATHGNLALGLRTVAAAELEPERLAVISSNYHLERARKMLEIMGVAADLVPAESVVLQYCPHRAVEMAEWLIQVANTGIMANELAKIADPDYWAKREAYLRTPWDQMPEPVDISCDVAATRERLKASGASSVQNEAF